MFYAVPPSTIVKLKQLISKLLRTWLGLSLNAFPKIGLYIRQTPKCLSFLLVELYKVAKECLLLSLRQFEVEKAWSPDDTDSNKLNKIG